MKMQHFKFILFGMISFVIISCLNNNKGSVAILNTSDNNLYYEWALLSKGEIMKWSHSKNIDSLELSFLKKGGTATIILPTNYNSTDSFHLRFFTIDTLSLEKKYAFYSHHLATILFLEDTYWMPLAID
jgi:hypothetical protein